MGKGVTRVEELSGNRNVGEQQMKEMAEEGKQRNVTGRLWEGSEILEQKPVQGSEE